MPVNRKLLIVPVTMGLLMVLWSWGWMARAGLDPAQMTGMVRQKQDPGKSSKRTEEEDDEKPAAGKEKKRVEEEEDRPAKSGVSRLDEEASKQIAEVKAPTDLETAAREAKHRDVKELYRALATPHDRVTMKKFIGVTVEGGKIGATLRVEPMAEYIGDLRDLKQITMEVLDGEGKRLRTEKGGAGSIQGIRYYEQVAMDLVSEFLEKKYTAFAAGNPLYLSRYDQLMAAEFALSAALRFHQSAREVGIRKGTGWDEVEAGLRTKLLEVLLLEMEQLREAKSWDQAFALTRRIVETFHRRGDHARIAGPLAELLKAALEDASFTQGQLKEIRTRLRFLEDRFPGSEVLTPIADSLQKQARELFVRAQELVKQKKPAEAIELLKQAEETWPELPGLRTYRLSIDRSYQILRVGVRELPRYLSPGWACTDTEWRAVELLFESLVELTADERGALYYRPGLAEGRCKVVPLGRQFKLPRNARWSDDKPISVGDLRFTVAELRKGTRTGRSPAWGELLQGVDAGADPSRVSIRLKQGLLDPRGAMSFKILPARSSPHPTSEEFAENPISSGPFIYRGRMTETTSKGRTYAAFHANPNYGVREEKLGMPRIREVRLFATSNPVKDLRSGDLDLVLDLTAEQAAQLEKEDVEITWPTPRTVNRRIWFLAVNHRKTGLDRADVRIALARAIAREPLLDEHFRKGAGGRRVHRALNGPYPAGSWACDPTLVSRTDKSSLDPFDAELAKAKLGNQKLTLTLLYPTGNVAVEEAMRSLCEQVGRVLPGVRLVPEAKTPYELRKAVEETHNYDLAYYHYDYEDETFWLYPLLGPFGRGHAENYLGYTGSLVDKVQRAMTLRHFDQVREYAQAIHRQFLESDMPLIPLWQLDGLHAYRQGMVEVTGVIDPLLVFTEIEEWRVRPQ